MFWTLMAGTALLLASLLSYGTAMALILRVVVRLIRSGYAGLGFWNHLAVMMIVTLITAAAHLIQIALWAVALLPCEQISDFETAFYFSAENYTALGYGDIVLQGQWRLLGPLEAMNGLLFFGLSTAVLFAVMSHLIGQRLNAEFLSASRAAVTDDVASKRAENSLSGTHSHAG